jgi:hypothetical protein
MNMAMTTHAVRPAGARPRRTGADPSRGLG